MFTLFAFAAEVFSGDQQQDPIFGGVPLSTLLENVAHRLVLQEPTLGMHNGGFVRDPKAADALRQTGTNALPYLIEMIRGEPSHAFLAATAFEILGPTASPAIPALELLATTCTNDETCSRVVWAIHCTGSNSVPALARLTTNDYTRIHAVVALTDLGAKGVMVQPILVKAMNKGDIASTIAVSGVRNWSSTNAIPLLTNVLHHPKVSMRKVALETIYGFTREAQPAIPVITECLYDPDPEIRHAAADILRRIAPEMFVTNSVLHK